MRVSADENCCIASGLCARTAPAVFGQDDDDVVVVRTARPPAELHDSVREAARFCPGGAIIVSDS